MKQMLKSLFLMMAFNQIAGGILLKNRSEPSKTDRNLLLYSSFNEKKTVEDHLRKLNDLYTRVRNLRGMLADISSQAMSEIETVKSKLETATEDDEYTYAVKDLLVDKKASSP